MLDLILRLPREDEEEEFLRAHRATSPEVPDFLHHYRDGMAFRRYLEVLNAQAPGANLTPAQVPATFLFAFVGVRILCWLPADSRLFGCISDSRLG